jgi:hypothetical protein
MRQNEGHCVFRLSNDSSVSRIVQGWRVWLAGISNPIRRHSYIEGS